MDGTKIIYFVILLLILSFIIANVLRFEKSIFDVTIFGFHIQLELLWYDGWAGYYWSKNDVLYVIPWPYVVFSFTDERHLLKSEDE